LHSAVPKLSYPGCNFVATGSAAAALKLKSHESGAGRFTDFILPPLTFAEYLQFVGKEDALIERQEQQKLLEAMDIDPLDEANQ
jgi:predicted AAA+ superfamily ATPase